MDNVAETSKLRHPPEHPEGIHKVQVGCGPQHLRPDWWNTDLRAFPGIDEAFDATQTWRWNGILDFVYAEHFIEHLEIDKAIAFLVEARRALKPGGKIRLSTPSLEWVIKSHYTFHAPRTPDEFEQTLLINRAFYGWGHRFLYSKGVLERVLHEAGYINMRFHQYGQSDTPALNGLELHETSSDIDTQWIIEGERGTDENNSPEAFIAELENKMLNAVRGGH